MGKSIFNNLSEFNSWVKSEYGQGILLDDGLIYERLTKAGEKLESYLKEELENYFNVIYPESEVKMYKRTGNTLNSIKVGKPQKISPNFWTLSITFDEDLAYHPSYIDEETQPKGYTPWLLEVGWDIRQKVKRDIPMFTHHSPTHYIKNAVDKFNSDNSFGLYITVEHNGERYI